MCRKSHFLSIDYKEGIIIYRGFEGYYVGRQGVQEGHISVSLMIIDSYL
jgi:hypothetical protein